jgi:hypothetical protein
MKECGHCKKVGPFWKRVKGIGYCQTCSKILFPTKGLNKRSTKKVKADSEYSDLRRNFLNKHPLCMAHLPGCTQQSTDIHHTRGRYGVLYLDVSTWVSLCRFCHSMIELNPELGRDIGLVKQRR